MPSAAPPYRDFNAATPQSLSSALHSPPLPFGSLLEPLSQKGVSPATPIGRWLRLKLAVPASAPWLPQGPSRILHGFPRPDGTTPGFSSNFTPATHCAQKHPAHGRAAIKAWPPQAVESAQTRRLIKGCRAWARAAVLVCSRAAC